MWSFTLWRWNVLSSNSVIEFYDIQCEYSWRIIRMQVRQLNKYNFVVDSFLFSFNRSISSPVHSVLVNDGSMCGESSFCQKNTCVQQKTERSCDSLKTCSGNGVSHSHFQFPLSFFYLYRFVQQWVSAFVIHRGKETIVRSMIINMKIYVCTIVHYHLQLVCFHFTRLCFQFLYIDLRINRFCIANCIRRSSNDNISFIYSMHYHFMFISVGILLIFK